MNIDKIIKDCPRTWEEFIKDKCLHIDHNDNYFKSVEVIDHLMIFSYHGTNDTRMVLISELFSFFDSKGIKMIVFYIPDNDIWTYNIIVNREAPLGKKYFRIGAKRESTERSGFTHCFEVMEAQLNKDFSVKKEG